jgi:1-hydroxycarotenoid 3,4-desaturase
MTDVIIVGAGIGGLTAAALLAAAGRQVAVYESAGTPGGKLREVAVNGSRIDSGPTVFTLRPVFEAIFAAASAKLEDHLTLTPLPCLCRHVWEGSAPLDLTCDTAANAAAIAQFAGANAARAYEKFAARAGAIFEMLDSTFMQIQQPGLAGLLVRAGPRLAGISPFNSLWQELAKYFPDSRLHQLFGRYATYCGSSPFAAPATLMLITHAEQRGVWSVEGGMFRLATALETVAKQNGATFHYNAAVSEITASNSRVSGIKLASGEIFAAKTVIANADLMALSTGLLGPAARAAVAGFTKGAAPSLSALTWSLTGSVSGFTPTHHNVFFSRDYPGEFVEIADRKLPTDPTIYLCAPDGANGRFFLLINAAAGLTPSPDAIESAFTRAVQKLAACGATLSVAEKIFTGPNEFATRFPGSAGALYGRALDGWKDSFARPGAKTRLPGLYLAGGSVHPGPGLPMAALSGKLAAQCVLSTRL